MNTILNIRFILVELLIIFFCVNCFAAKEYNNELLQKLDYVIECKEYYIRVKELRLDSLKKVYANVNPDRRYNVGKLIFKEYLKYNHDSAKCYFEYNKSTAIELEDSGLILDNMIDEVSLLSTVGMYHESWDLIQRLNKNRIIEDFYYPFEKSKEFFYEGLIAYSEGKYKEMYKDSLDAVYTRMLVGLSKNSIDRDDVVIRRLFHQGKWAEVVHLIDKYLLRIDQSSNKYAMTLYMQAIAYKNLSQRDQYVNTLIKCAIVDISSATKEYMSLGDLSWALFKEDNIARAHNYAQVALRDANDFKARQHSMQIAEILPIINEAHNRSQLKETRLMQLFTLIFLVITILLCILFLNLRRKTNRIIELKESIELVNLALVDSDKLKDRYIGYFIHQCSDYIIQLTQLRKKIYKLTKEKNYTEVIRLTSEYRKITSETEELYGKFDTAFLYLYPTFIEDLNSLFDNYVLERSNNGLLSGQQRICALIRVGINESSQIANFLGYSVNTVYTYRTKMRNKAKDRELFESNILDIGSKNCRVTP